MKKILAILFAFNLIFINYAVIGTGTAFAQLSAPGVGTNGPGRNSEDGTGLGNSSSNIFSTEASTDGSDDVNVDDGEGVLSTIAGYVSSAAFSVVNAVATVAYSVGLDTIGNAITGFGYSFASNVASEQGLTATAAGAAASAALGGLGGFIVGPLVTGSIQGTIGGDINSLVGGVVGGSDIPKSGISGPSDQTPPYIPNIPKSTTNPIVEVGDNCPTKPVNYTFDIRKHYERVFTQDYKPNWGDNDVFIVQVNVASTDTTKGGQLIGANYSDVLASRAAARVTISRTKCDFGNTAQWFGHTLGYQPSDPRYPGLNSASQTFSVNDQRSGIMNLTTGTWYITFQYLDCADKNLANPNRNTTCHKVIDLFGDVNTMAASTDNIDILKNIPSSGQPVVLNSFNTLKIKNSASGFNDLGVAIPKTLSIEDIINPSILNTVKSWAGLATVSDPIRSMPPAVVTGTSAMPASSAKMILVGNDTYNLGGANLDSVLTDSRSFFKYENLNWTTLCANADIKPIITVNGVKDYTRQLKAGLEVYPFDVPANPIYEGNATAVGLSTSSNLPAALFISDTPCPRTSANVYKFSDGQIMGTTAEFSNINYTGSAPGNVKVSPGRWYMTILWGTGAKPAPTSQNYASWVDGTARLDVRFFNRLTGTNATVAAFNNARTISNSTCSINISGAQYGTVNTMLVYKKFPPNVPPDSYFLGNASVAIPRDYLLTTTTNTCPGGEGSPSGKTGNRSTFSALNVECKIGTDLYKLDYPDSCSTLCASANSAAFIDVRGDCVINGGGSF